MRNIYKHTQWIAILLLLFASCNDEKTFSPKGGNQYQAKLMFNVIQTISRAGESDDEVKRADILLFKEGKLEKIMRNITSFTTTPQGYTSVDISLATEGVRKAYVVVNIDDTSWLESLEIGATTLEEMEVFQTAQLVKMANPPFVMYGISEDISFGVMDNSSLCPLYRTVARICVKNKATNFELQSAKLLRSKVASTIFPSATISNSELKDFDTVEVEGDSVVLYSYENRSTDLEHATAVEITGLVNGAELIYTVPMVVGDQLIPLQRNYQYQININNVQTNVLNTTITVRPWKIGEDISNVVTGSKPVVDVTLDPTVGVFTAADSSFVIGSTGGRIHFNVKANAECDIRFEEMVGNWLVTVPETRAPSSIESRFVVDVMPNSELIPRAATIVVFNKLNGVSKTFSVKQQEGISQKDRFMVLVVAGQSNASGYDATGIGPEDATDPRVFQLSYGLRGAKNLDIIPLTADADDIDDYVNGATRSLKGIHLPLAQELLKSLPVDTRILVVPVSCTGTGFKLERPLGDYDEAGMKPNMKQDSRAQLRWGTNSAYYRTMVDRVKYALNLNQDNKFLGVVWCQGEYDRNMTDGHYTAFTDMAQHFFSELNASGLGARTSFGTFDKRVWYTFSSTSNFMNWYSDSDASVLFSGYKQWNPDGFIHVPFNTPVNPENAGGGSSHFGYGSYRKIIAPAVAQCMDENGSLFNGVTPHFDRFDNAVSLSEANKFGGSLTDADIQNDLNIYMPFSDSVSEKIGAGRVNVSGVDLVNASGLRDITGAVRSRQSAKFSNVGNVGVSRGIASVNQWSISFMLKRTGGLEGEMQTVLSNGTSSSPFIGFRYYGKSQRCAGITSFTVEPSYQSVSQPGKSVPGLLLNADRVRSLTQWIHYVVTYDNTTKECIIYMNGEEVQRARLTGLGDSKISNIQLGYTSGLLRSFEGEMMEFFYWGRVITPATVKKLYLMGYYGFSK